MPAVLRRLPIIQVPAGCVCAAAAELLSAALPCTGSTWTLKPKTCWQGGSFAFLTPVLAIAANIKDANPVWAAEDPTVPNHDRFLVCMPCTTEPACRGKLALAGSLPAEQYRQRAHCSASACLQHAALQLPRYHPCTV